MTKGLPSIKEFPKDGRIWRVDWYGGIMRKSQDRSEPEIQLIISPLKPGLTDYTSDDSVVHEERCEIEIGIGQLPGVTVGSLWLDRHCLNNAAGVFHTFRDIAVSPETVKEYQSNHKDNFGFVLPFNQHRIGRGLGSRFLALEWASDPMGLIIPTAEVIRFYYATSTNLAEAIFEGAFCLELGLLDSLIKIEDCGFHEKSHRCFITLRKHIADADAWTIGRILYDALAMRGANLVYHSLVKQTYEGGQLSYPSAAFPFIGTTNLKARVKKIRLPNGRSRYIVLALEHCTGPFPYNGITCPRQNDGSSASHDTDLPDEEKTPLGPWNKPSKATISNGELQSAQEPSKDIQTIQVDLPGERFGALIGKKLDRPTKEMCHYISSPGVISLTMNGLSLGTGVGDCVSDNKVVPISLNTMANRQQALPANLEKFNEVVQYLNSLQECKVKLRNNDVTIAYLPLTERSSQRQWSYLNSATKQRRHIAVADVFFKNCWYSLVEFERRTTGKESFVLAIIFNNGFWINSHKLRALLFDLAKAKGRWVNIPQSRMMFAYKTLEHRQTTVESRALSVKGKMESMLKNPRKII